MIDDDGGGGGGGGSVIYPVLDAPRRTRALFSASLAPRTWRRCRVAVTLAGADLGTGLAALQSAAALTGEHLRIGGGAVFVLSVVYWVLGMYEGFGPCPYERLRMRAQGITLFILADCALGVVAGAPARLGFLGVICVLLLLLGYYTEICARTVLIRRGLWGGATVFVGFGPDSQQLACFLQQHPEFGLCPKGFVRTAEETAGHMPLPLPLLGGLADLERVASQIEVVVFRPAADTAMLMPSLLRNLHFRQLMMVGDSRDVPSLWLRTRTLGGLIGVELRRDSCTCWSRRFKRMLDLVVAVPCLLVAAPVIALAALAVKVVDGGPVFYVQDRVGMENKTIGIWKLRTMYQDAERRLEDHLAQFPTARAEWQRFFKLSEDPRILPVVGKALRRTSLDELPQLWNVLWGQMSLVGPRPFPAYHVDSFDREFQLIRSSVPPGISGLWQVAARSNGDLEVQRAQDLFYILNWSIWLDLYVLIETPMAVISTRGAK